MADWSTIVTSAAIGALTSSVLSLAGQYFERRARRRELLLKVAVDLADKRNERARERGKPRQPMHEIVVARMYFEALALVLDRKELPSPGEWRAELRAQDKTARAQQRRIDREKEARRIETSKKEEK